MTLKSKKLIPLWVILFAVPAIWALPLRVSFSPGHQILERTSEAFNDVARKASPAVVSIDSIRKVSGHEQMMADPLNLGSPSSSLAPRHAMGVGSGAIIRSDGLILTSFHVVENAERIRVVMKDKTEKRAHLVSADPKTDIALIQFDKVSKNLPTVSFADSDAVQVGDWSIAIGSPFGLTQTVTSGIISAKGRGQMGMMDIEDFFQTDTPINPGNSGGPLLNTKGEMIGLNAAIFSQSGGFLGIGFAIPSNLVHQVTEDLISHGRVIRGYLGVSAQDLNDEIAKYFRTPGKKGALVSEVRTGGPADEGKMKVGDVILTYDEKPVNDATHLKELVAKSQIGKRVNVSLTRDGKPQILQLVVHEMPQIKPHTQMAAQAAFLSPSTPPLGMEVQDIPPEVRQLLMLPASTGAFILGVQPGGLGFDSGLAPGDIILKANDQVIHGAGDFNRIAKRDLPQKTIMLYIQRGPQGKVFVPLNSPVT